MNKHTLSQIENTFGSILSTSSSLANDNTVLFLVFLSKVTTGRKIGLFKG